MHQNFNVCFVSSSPLATEHFARYAEVLTERKVRVCLLFASQQQQRVDHLAASQWLTLHAFGNSEELLSICFSARRLVVDVQAAEQIIPNLDRSADAPIRSLYIAEESSWVSQAYNDCIKRMLPLVQELLYASFHLPAQGVQTGPQEKAYHPELRVRGVGYYCNSDAKALSRLRQETPDWRSRFFSETKLEDLGQKVVCYLGRDEATHHDGDFGRFVDRLDGRLSECSLIYAYVPAQHSRDEDIERLQAHQLLKKKIVVQSPFQSPLEMLAACDAAIYNVHRLACAAGLCGIPVIHMGAHPGDEFWYPGAIHECGHLDKLLNELALNQLQPPRTPAELRNYFGKSRAWKATLEHYVTEPIVDLSCTRWLPERPLSEQLEPLKSSLMRASDMAGMPVSLGGSVEFRDLRVSDNIVVKVSMKLETRSERVGSCQYRIKEVQVFTLMTDRASYLYDGAKELDRWGHRVLCALLPPNGH